MSFGYAVYFTERVRNRVIRWDPDSGDTDVIAGEPSNGDRDQTLRDPYGLTFDKEGFLLIADKLNHRICRLRGNRLETLHLRDLDGHRARLPNSWVHYDSTLRCPTGLFMETSGTLLCTFADDYTVYRIHENGRLEHLLGMLRNRNYHFGTLRDIVASRDVKNVPLNGPTSIVARRDGSLYFIERMPQVVRAYHQRSGLRCLFPSEGGWQRGQRAIGPGSVSFKDYHPAYPASLALDSSDNLYMTDIVQGCVLRVDVDAARVTKVMEVSSPPSASLGGPAALAFGTDGTAWIMNTVTMAVEAYEVSKVGAWKSKGVLLTQVEGKKLQLPSAGSGLATG